MNTEEKKKKKHLLINNPMNEAIPSSISPIVIIVSDSRAESNLSIKESSYRSSVPGCSCSCSFDNFLNWFCSFYLSWSKERQTLFYCFTLAGTQTKDLCVSLIPSL
jgi:hypothetical protein